MGALRYIYQVFDRGYGRSGIDHHRPTPSPCVNLVVNTGEKSPAGRGGVRCSTFVRAVNLEANEALLVVVSCANAVV